MEVWTSAEAARRWGVTPRQVQRLLRQGRVVGAVRRGHAWLIPAGAEHPDDLRAADRMEAPYLGVSVQDSLRFDGRSPEAMAAALPDDETRTEFFVELAIHRGENDKALALMEGLRLNGRFRLCRLYGTAVIAIRRNDTEGAARALESLEASARQEALPSARACAELMYSIIYASIYEPSRCAPWLKHGDFSALPQGARPFALYAYGRYLHAMGESARMLGVLEAGCALLGGEGFSMPEMHLLLLRVIAYLDAGWIKQAKQALTHCFGLARGYGFYIIFAENIVGLRGILDEVLHVRFPKDAPYVLDTWKQAYAGWVNAHNALSAHRVSTALTLRESQVAQYLSQGCSYKEIAARMGVSLSTVRNCLQSVREKLDIHSAAEIARRVRWVSPEDEQK